MNKYKFFIIFVSVFIISTLLLFAPSVYATSESDTLHKGFVSGDFVLVGGDGLVAESLNVSYSFTQELKVFDENNASSYTGSVESEYVLYNNSDKDVSALFYVKNSNVPQYFYGTPSYTQVYLDTKELQYNTRATLTYSDDKEKNNYISAINGAVSGDGFVHPDTEVYVQRFRVTVADPDITKCYVALMNYNGTLPILSYNLYLINTKDYGEVVYFDTVDYGILEVASIGVPLGDEISWIIADKTSDAYSQNFIDGKVELVSTENTDYYSFVAQKTDLSGALLSDYANCISAYISANNGLKAFNESLFFSKDKILIWKETVITVPAGERVTLKISEPFFPSISQQYIYNNYVADYSIVGFQRSEDFYFKLEIDTPYLLEGNTSLIKNDIGYYYENIGFSAQTFTFTLTNELSAGSNDDDESYCGGWGILIGILINIAIPIIALIMILLSLILTLLVPLGIAFAVVMLIKLIVAIIIKCKNR